MYLAVQLGAAAIMVLVATLIHGFDLSLVSRLFQLRGDRLEEHEWDARAIGLMLSISLALFAIHTIEIIAYALFYDLAGVFDTFGRGLFFSAASYTTLGYSADLVEGDWQLLVASEAVVGFLLLGWSTAFLVRNITKLRA